MPDTTFVSGFRADLPRWIPLAYESVLLPVFELELTLERSIGKLGAGKSGEGFAAVGINAFVVQVVVVNHCR
jgi:hypothetical protein